MSSDQSKDSGKGPPPPPPAFKCAQVKDPQVSNTNNNQRQRSNSVSKENAMRGSSGRTGGATGRGTSGPLSTIWSISNSDFAAALQAQSNSATQWEMEEADEEDEEDEEGDESDEGDEEDIGEEWDDDIEQVLQARTSEPSMKNTGHDQHQLCGITNDGFTCYANACFQMLYTSSALRDYFLAHTFSGPFHTALSCLFAAMQARSSEALADEYYPSTSADFFNQVFRLEAPQFVSGHQHDAQEYMTILLDLLHREVNLADRTPLHNTPPISAQQAWDYHLQHIDNSFLSGTLVGQVESLLTCLTCRRQSRSWSCVWQLQLQLQPQSGNTAQRTPTLKDCIDEYMADEILQGDCAPTCFRCGTRQAASKKQTMCRVPQALLIHLKRFTPNGTKIDCPVEIDIRLTLSAVPQEQLLVHSAILHRGTENNGHYMTLFREDDNKWVLFDDDSLYDDITNPQASIIMRKCAYLVIYYRVTSAGPQTQQEPTQVDIQQQPTNH